MRRAAHSFAASVLASLIGVLLAGSAIGDTTRLRQDDEIPTRPGVSMTFTTPDAQDPGTQPFVLADPVILPAAQATIVLNAAGNIPAAAGFHPGFGYYYVLHAGALSFEGSVYNATGTKIQFKQPIDADARSVYYNRNTGNLECVPYGAKYGFLGTGLQALGLDGAGLLTASNVSLLPEMPAIPDEQSAPAYDPARNRFYARGAGVTVSIVYRSDGTLAGTVNLDLVSAGSPTLQASVIGFDPDWDVLITLDRTNSRALVHRLDGSYIGASTIPPFNLALSILGFGYANGQVFVYDSETNQFRGYRIFKVAPRIAAIEDVGNDQGRQVRIRFSRCPLDFVGSSQPITSYSVFRRIDPLPAHAPRTPVTEATGADPNGVLLAGWDFVTTVPAFTDDEYNVVVPTLADSNGTGTHRSAFLIRAATASPAVFYTSPEDSGYSVDNLAPAMPSPFTGVYGGGGTTLDWAMNEEADFLEYRLYRGGLAGFVPGPGNLIQTQGGTGFFDAGDAGSYYKLVAVDQNGNVSPVALLSPTETLDVAGVASGNLELRGVRPNPTRGDLLAVDFVLPRSATARLELVDLTGRRLIRQEVGALGAGRHQVDLARGARLAPGLYWVRLTQGDDVRSTRAVVME